MEKRPTTAVDPKALELALDAARNFQSYFDQAQTGIVVATQQQMDQLQGQAFAMVKWLESVCARLS